MRKLVLMIAQVTLATMEIHHNALWSPRFSVRERCLYTGIVVLLTAWGYVIGVDEHSDRVAGKMLTWAPILTRNFCLIVWSTT